MKKRILIAFITFIMASLCNAHAQYVFDLGYDDGGINRLIISDSFTPQIEEQNISGYEQEVLSLEGVGCTIYIPLGSFFGWSLKNGQGELIELGPFKPDGDVYMTYNLSPEKEKLVIEGLKGDNVIIYENGQTDEGREVEATNPLIIDLKGSIREIILPSSINLIFVSK